MHFFYHSMPVLYHPKVISLSEGEGAEPSRMIRLNARRCSSSPPRTLSFFKLARPKSTVCLCILKH